MLCLELTIFYDGSHHIRQRHHSELCQGEYICWQIRLVSGRICIYNQHHDRNNPSTL